MLGCVPSVKILDFPDLPERGDVQDWLDTGHTVEELVSLVDALAEYEPEAPHVDGASPRADDGVPTATFPEAAWRGIFGAYRELVGPTTEAPDTYHFWLCAFCLGTTLGRRLSVYHARRLYPNFFTVLVGPTGWGRKDTAWNRIEDILKDLHVQSGEECGSFELIPGIGSAEGLIDALSGGNRVVVVREAEFLALISKARQDNLSNLIPQLTALYDSPDHHTMKTRSKPVDCRYLFLSLASATTRAWLKKAITERDILGGFANRFIYIPGTPKDAIPYPPPVDSTRRQSILSEINDIREWADTLDSGAQVVPTPRAIKRFSDWYGSFHLQSHGDGLLPALAVRFQDFAWKLALLYAAADRSPEIDVSHIDPALAVVDWQWEANRAIFADFAGSGRELEETAMARLSEAPGRQLSTRDLYRGLHKGAEETVRMMDALGRLGFVQPANISLNGSKKSVPGYRLVS